MFRITALLIVMPAAALAWQGIQIVSPQKTARQAEYAAILDQMARLEGSIELDRRDYLPGEMICLTATVANPTNQPLMAFHPFESDYTGSVTLRMYRDGGWDFMGSDPYRLPADPMLGKTVIQMAPGQRLSQSGCFGDVSTRRPMNGSLFGILSPGDYKAVFHYAKEPEASFRVIKFEGHPLFVKSVVAELNAIFDPLNTDSRYCRGVVVAAVRVGDSTVFVRTSPMANACKTYYGLDDLRHFTRIAEVTGAISELQLHTSDDGTMELSYRDSRGYLARHVLPRAEVRYDPSGKATVLWKDGQGRERRRSIADSETSRAR